MLGFLTKVFGSKSERDIKALQPIVIKINEEYSKLSVLSNDELRNKTVYFKDVIAQALAEIDGKISGLKADGESQDLSLAAKTALYDQIDELIKELTEEYNTTTVVVTHDMNSVMGIGDYILFLHEGKKFWEGSNKEIAHTDIQELNDFVFASRFMKAAKDKF